MSDARLDYAPLKERDSDLTHRYGLVGRSITAQYGIPLAFYRDEVWPLLRDSIALYSAALEGRANFGKGVLDGAYTRSIRVNIILWWPLQLRRWLICHPDLTPEQEAEVARMWASLRAWIVEDLL